MSIRRLKKLLGYHYWKQREIRRSLSDADVASTAMFDWGRVDVRGKRGCSLAVGDRSMIECDVTFERDNARVRIGERTFIGRSHLVASHQIVIGSDVLISWNVTIVDHNSHSVRFSERSQDVLDWRVNKKDWSHVVTSPVTVGDKSWIGFNSIILKGVTIGEGAVVGAGSVVTKDVAPWTIVAGNPARLIREIPESER